MLIRKLDYIEGLGIRLRNANVSDALFILRLRTDTRLNSHISKVDGTLEQQKQFLTRYENIDTEAFFVVESLDGEPLGTIRMYDQKDNSFCWGSWIVLPGSPLRTGLKSALLLYIYGFEVLGFHSSHFDVRQKNEHVWGFHEGCGAQLMREDELNRYYTLPRSAWDIMKQRYASILNNEAVKLQDPNAKAERILIIAS